MPSFFTLPALRRKRSVTSPCTHLRKAGKCRSPPWEVEWERTFPPAKAVRVLAGRQPGAWFRNGRCTLAPDSRGAGPATYFWMPEGDQDDCSYHRGSAVRLAAPAQ